MPGRSNPTYYGETDRHLKVKFGEHNGISPLKFTKTKLSMESAILDHLLECTNIPSFQECTILANRSNKFVLEIKETLLIKGDGRISRGNISFDKLLLFENSLLFNCFYRQ